ncbi:rod shape-determining protein MreC [Clostridium polynesiense]|uniref:rod shape-determining protein MreC n=1 Tax=Clostridium polynesiense TaxID=1325933 RepID=UPI00058C5E24|nr:rod shape-determining protein MreC [Clostridium polynesiense]
MKFLKNKLAVTIVVLSVGFLALIGYSVKRENNNIVAGGLGNILNPIQSFVYGINSKAQGFLDFAFNFKDVRAENKRLREENEKLKSDLLEYDSIKGENERFREIFDFKNQRSEYKYVGCNIVGIGGNSFLNSYIIDKGEKDGITKGMVVISSQGLVGQISRAESNWAIVDSIINENIAVSVTVQSTKESVGIVKGYRDSDNRLLAKVYNLPLDSEVKPGDVISTSGLGRIYPKGIRVGTVMSVEEDKGKLMKIAVVQPFVDFNRLEELFIVIPEDIRNIQY